MSTAFRDSAASAFQRLVRTTIRKSGLTKGQQAVTLAVVNLWFHHKSGPGAVIYPGREKLAKKADVSVRTVATTLDMLRAAGVLRVVSHPKGGRAATRYRVRVTPLLILCGADLPDWMEGELRLFTGQSCTLSEPEIARFGSAKIAHGKKKKKYVSSDETQSDEIEFDPEVSDA